MRLYQYKYARQGITRNNNICLIYQLVLQITSNYFVIFQPMLTITRTTAFVLFQCLPLHGQLLWLNDVTNVHDRIRSTSICASILGNSDYNAWCLVYSTSNTICDSWSNRNNIWKVNVLTIYVKSTLTCCIERFEKLVPVSVLVCFYYEITLFMSDWEYVGTKLDGNRMKKPWLTQTTRHITFPDY